MHALTSTIISQFARAHMDRVTAGRRRLRRVSDGPPDGRLPGRKAQPFAAMDARILLNLDMALPENRLQPARSRRAAGGEAPHEPLHFEELLPDRKSVV